MRKTKKTMNTNSVKLLLGIMALSFGLTSCDRDESQTVTTLNNLVWSDEFDVDGAPNSSNWSFDIGRGPGGDGWGNNEQQYYTDSEENIRVQSGLLIITAREESFGGADYTSARINSKDLRQFDRGRIEARMQLPWGKGLWPAFWMLGADIDVNPWPGAGEIDILENVGQEPTIMFGSVHGPGYCGSPALCDEPNVSKEYDLGNDRFDTGFHVFGIEWGDRFINYYVDDVLYYQLTPDELPEDALWVFDKPFYLLLNVAVGGNLPGPPNDDTVFPQQLLVDYVRVYQ